MGYILSILFFTLVSGRLSLVLDLFLDTTIPDRVLTKTVWLVTMGIVIIFWIIKRYREKDLDFKSLIAPFRKYGLVLILVGIYLFSTICGAFLGYDFGVGIMTSVYYIILLLLYLIGWLLFRKGDGDTFKKSILVTTIVLSLIGVFQYADYRANQHLGWFISLFDHGGYVPASFFNIRTEDIGIFLRPSSLMVDTNIFAVFLALTIVMCVDFIMKGHYKILSIVALLFSISNIVLTASRTGFLILLVGLFLYFTIIYRGKIINLLRFGSGRGVVSIIPIIFSRFSLSDFSASEHINYWVQSIKIFVKYPFLGIGSGNFPKYYKENLDSAIEFATPHSVYAKILAENGLFGIISFSLFLMAYMYNLVRRKAVLPVVLMVMIVVGNITYDFLLTPWVWFLMGAFLSDIEW